MRKITSLILAVFMVLSLGACAEKPEETTRREAETLEDAPELDNIVKSVYKDAENVKNKIREEQQRVDDTIGTSYAGYINGKEVLLDWYEFIEDESEDLYDRCERKYHDYYRQMLTSIDTDDMKAVEAAVDYLKKQIFSDFYDVYAQDIYDEFYEPAKEKYIDGIIMSAEGSVNSSKLADVYDEASADNENSYNEFRKDYIEARSDFEEENSFVKKEFLRGNFEIEAILIGAKINREEKEKQEELKKDGITLADSEDYD